MKKDLAGVPSTSPPLRKDLRPGVPLLSPAFPPYPSFPPLSLLPPGKAPGITGLPSPFSPSEQTENFTFPQAGGKNDALQSSFFKMKFVYLL